MKVLFIACYSPMINNSASIETLQYLNNLAEYSDNTIHLLTVDFPKDSVYYDENIFKLLNKKVVIHNISGGRLFEKLMPRKSNNQGQVLQKSGTVNNFLHISNVAKRIKNYLIMPDMYFNWAKKASKLGMEIIINEKIDVIFSMHEPPSSHICAMKIKENYMGIPWVAYWSDPWIKDPNRKRVPRIRKKIESLWEEKVVKLADKHIFVTEANRKYYIETYNLQKESTFLINRGYDENLYDAIRNKRPLDKNNKSKVEIVYTGEIFSELRDVNPFIGAMKRIRDEHKECYNSLNINFYGNIDKIETINKINNLENIEVHQRVSYDKALEYMINSDILIVFGNKKSTQIPAKIYDYFGTDALILVILGDCNDPLKSVVENREKCIVVNNDEIEIENVLLKAVEMVHAGVKHGPVKEFGWKNISYKLYSILKG